MWTAFVAKLYSFFFAVLMLFGSLSIPGGRLCPVKIDYAFSDAMRGTAGGTVSVSAIPAGDYSLYWGDENGRKLTAETGAGQIPYTEFATVSVCGGRGSTEIYAYTAIPEGAQTVLAYTGAVCRGSAAIPEEKQPENEAPLYTFGSISDVHFNRYNRSLTGDDAVIAFQNALDFYNANNVSLVAVSGDICTNGEEDSLQKFHRIASQYDFPVYACTGNHDVGDGPIWDLWVKYINADVYAHPDRPDVAIAPNGIDFVYRPESFGGDVFVFLSQRYWDYRMPQSRLLDDDQLDWLEGVLAQYQAERVYLYFHTFMADDAGNPVAGEGNCINDKGVYYDLFYTVGTADEVRLRALMRQYKNVVFFNGHSHFDFDTNALNPQINITSYGGEYATFVHNPSVSAPRNITACSSDYYDMSMLSSQGYLVKVYADRLVLTGVEFWGARFVSYATFNIF